MKRKILIPAFAFVVLVAVFAFSLSGSETRNYKDIYNQKTVNGVVYALDEKGQYYVKDFFATDELAQKTTEINIVSEIDGTPVKGISPTYLFSESYPGVDIITIDEGIEYIGEKAFSVLDGVKKITLPESVVEIGKGAFSEMESLTDVTLPSGITEITDDMFLSCSRLLNVNISEKITSVGEYAFAGCRRLSAFQIPESVEYIGEAAFRGTGLTYIYIPSGVRFAEDGSMHSWFKGCTSLRKVEFGGSKNKKIVITDFSFSGCSALEEVVLPEAEEIIICEGAFENCKALKRIENAENISCIGSSAFYNCGFEKIKLPAGIEFKDVESGKNAVSVFENCQKLKTVVFETERKSLGFLLVEEMFKDCTVLSRVMLPLTDGEIIFSDRAFEGCRSLLGVYNTYSVSLIGEEAFSGCVSLELFVLPEKVTEISEKCFYGCKRLSKIYLHGNLRKIGDGAFSKCQKLTDIYYEGRTEEYGRVEKGKGRYKSKIRYESECYSLLKGLRAEVSGTEIRILWEEDSKADGYRVYTIDGTVLKKVGDITDTEYIFRDLTQGQEYSFSVRAYYMVEGEKLLAPQKEIITVTV